MKKKIKKYIENVRTFHQTTAHNHEKIGSDAIKGMFT
jgi:hypothetical protein